MLIDIFLWIMEVKNMGETFCYRVSYYINTRQHSGPGDFGLVDAILIIINDGKTNNLLPYNNIISAIISALIIAYLFRKKIREKFHNSVRLHTLQSIIDSRAEKTPSRLFFFIAGERLIHYLWPIARYLACLRRHFDSVPMGGTAGVMAGNGWAAVQCLLAVPYHGRRVLLINTMAGKAGVTHAITHSGCPLIFADAAHIEILRELVAANNINIVPIDCDTGIAADTPTTPPSVKINDDALLIYTSGTTGKPKGVLHTHGSLLAGGANTALAHQLTENDRAFCVLPLCHINAQCVTVMGALASGGGVVVPHKFSVAKFWRQLAQTECTWFSVVPTIVSHLLHGDKPPLPLPHLRFGRSASSALAPETHRQFEEHFGLKLYETMGLSETAAQILSNPMPPQKTKYGSRVLPLATKWRCWICRGAKCRAIRKAKSRCGATM